MKQQHVAIIVISLIMLVLPLSTKADESIRVMIDGNYVTLNNQPQVINNSVYLPLRDLAEILGADVQWIEESKTAAIIKPTAPTEPTLPTIVLNGESTTWPYWYEDEQLYMEYHDAVAMMGYCTTSRVTVIKYYTSTNRFIFNDTSIDLGYKMHGDYKTINVSSIDRNINSISFTFDPATSSVISD